MIRFQNVKGKYWAVIFVINLALFVHRVPLSFMPPYLSSYLRFGPSPRHWSFTECGFEISCHLLPVAKQMRSIFLSQKRGRAVSCQIFRALLSPTTTVPSDILEILDSYHKVFSFSVINKNTKIL
jgi:hypothetical protein